MTLGKRIQVEPLDDERLTNIERNIVIGVSERASTPARVPMRGFAFALGSVVAVAAAAVVGWKLHTVPAIDAPPVTPAEPTHFAMEVHDHARIQLAGAALRGDASFDVAADPKLIAIEMKRGSLDLDVVHDPRRTLVIHAADTEIEDVGTKFRVDFDGIRAVAVRVTEGEVRVTRHAQVVRVAAGSAWTTDGGLVALPTLDPPVVAVATTTTATTSHPVLAQHVATVPVATAQHGAVATTVTAHATIATTPPIVHTPVEVAIDPYVELRTAIRKIPLDHASGIDGHSDAAAEIAKLKKVAYSPTTLGPEASAALYQIAVLLYRPLGQDAEALHTLDMYRRRFAAGKEMHAAMWLRVRIQCSHAFDEACRQAAYSYQHEVPAGEASDVAIRITNAQ